MPSYDYKCKTCGHIFEARHGMNDSPPTCPAVVDHGPWGEDRVQSACGGEVQRLYSAPPAHFHGSGWAKDGYENKNLNGLLKKGGY